MTFFDTEHVFAHSLQCHSLLLNGSQDRLKVSLKCLQLFIKAQKIPFLLK